MITALIPADDRGFTLGHGLFETLLWNDGRFAFFDEHARRMQRACAELDLAKPTDAELRDGAEAALAHAALEGERAAVRLSWSAGSGGRGLDPPAHSGPRLVATAAAAPRRDGPITLALARVRRNESSPTSRLKTLSYLDNVVARAEARAKGCDEALMLNLKGQLACAAAANLFWTRGPRLYTPALECGVLDGVIRGRVIAAAQERGVIVQEVAAKKFVLLRAGAVFLTNSLMGSAHVASLDGVALGGDPPDWLVDVLDMAAAGSAEDKPAPAR